jgi:peptidoglycan/LPS O-acetylase OafA/YrhL
VSGQRHIRSDIKYQLLMSFVGLLLVVLLTVFPPAVTGDVPWRKPVFGSLFSVICVLGVLAVFSPNKCLKIFNIRNKNRNAGADSAKLTSHGTSNALAGHHPNCGNYGAHVFRIKGKTVCAACSGLLLGGLLALAGAVVYFFGEWNVDDYSFWMVLLGVAGVSFGLFQFKFSGLVRLSVNALFVFGALLILIGIDELVQSLVFDVFVVCLIIFWLLTRIYLSQWDHEMICSGCETENCMLRE